MLRQALLRIFAEQVSNSEWNISASEKVVAAFKPYLNLGSAECELEQKSFWKRPREEPLSVTPR